MTATQGPNLESDMSDEAVETNDVCTKCSRPLAGDVRGGRCDPCRTEHRTRLRSIGIALGVGAAAAAGTAVLIMIGRREGGWLDRSYDPEDILEPGTKVWLDTSKYDHLAVHPPASRWAEVVEVKAADFDPWYLLRGADGSTYGAQRDYIVRARRPKD
jgi:hypothetical protein